MRVAGVADAGAVRELDPLCLACPAEEFLEDRGALGSVLLDHLLLQWDRGLGEVGAQGVGCISDREVVPGRVGLFVEINCTREALLVNVAPRAECVCCDGDIEGRHRWADPEGHSLKDN